MAIEIVPGLVMICEFAADPEELLGLDSETERLRRHDPDALTAMVERYQHRLYRYLVRLVRDPATADDLFQQTWLRVIEKIRGYDASRDFSSWLFAVARNLAIDHLRKRRLESLDEPENSGTRADRLPSAGSGVFEGCLESERVGRVMKGLERIPPVYREVLTLRFEEEMKLVEIAETIGVPLDTVKSRLRRGLIRLREECV